MYNKGLTGIVEAHLDDTVDEDRLALDGYSLYKANNPQNAKSGDVGLYVNDSFPCEQRLNLVTLPECVMSEIQFSKKKYFYAAIYRSPS